MIRLIPFALPVLLQVASESPAPARRVLHLDDAVQTALRAQPTVLQARAAREAAAARVTQSRAGFLPQIALSASYQRIHGAARTTTATNAPGVPAAVPAGAAATTTTYDFFSFGGTASQLLWDFGQTYERWRSAETSLESFGSNQRATELQVLFNVRRAYFAARAQKDLIRVAEETLANHEKHLAQIQGFVGVGTRPEIDLAQARTDIANDRVALINAQNGYAIAKSQLQQAMGVMGAADFEVADEWLGPIDGEDQPSERLVERALAQRPELVAIEKQREAQTLTARSLRGGYGPALSAIGGAQETGTTLDSLTFGWNVGAALTWPIFQGGVTAGQVREAEANADVSRAQLEAERLQVRFDVEQAVLTVKAAKAAIAASEDALTNARDRLRLAEGRYEAGVGSIIELGDAQVAAANAAATVVQAYFNLSTARAQLLTALGRR